MGRNLDFIEVDPQTVFNRIHQLGLTNGELLIDYFNMRAEEARGIIKLSSTGDGDIHSVEGKVKGIEEGNVRINISVCPEYSFERDRWEASGIYYCRLSLKESGLAVEVRGDEFVKGGEKPPNFRIDTLQRNITSDLYVSGDLFEEALKLYLFLK